MTTEEERRIKRESGMLILGVVLGGLFGIVGGLWSGYFLEWYKSISPTANPDWTPVVIGSTILLVAFTAYLLHWAMRRLRS